MRKKLHPGDARIRRLLTSERRAKIGVALSGGIAYSIAHIGVLKRIESAGIPIDFLSGTSGGALIGALFAGGMPIAEMEDLATTIRWRDLTALTIPRMGLLSCENIERFVIDNIGDKEFNDLRIPLSIVAVDLATGQEVVLRTGRLARAVCASCAIPQLYAPVQYDDRVLVDGGVINKMPVAVVQEMGAEVTIGSDVAFKSRSNGAPANIVQVIFRVMAIVGEDRANLERLKADVMIYPDLEKRGAFNLRDAHEAVEEGFMVAEEAISQILHAIKRKSSFFYRLRRALLRRFRSGG